GDRSVDGVAPRGVGSRPNGHRAQGPGTRAAVELAGASAPASSSVRGASASGPEAGRVGNGQTPTTVDKETSEYLSPFETLDPRPLHEARQARRRDRSALPPEGPGGSIPFGRGAAPRLETGPGAAPAQVRGDPGGAVSVGSS